MKLAALTLFISAALALPAGSNVKENQGLQVITDELLFENTLQEFTRHRNAQDPAALNWTSDGCTSSPDNPFGFPFVTACNRHDFGYNNYRAQTRFTKSSKLRIDDNFKKDLDFQCQSAVVKFVCEALADVYYTAVRAFGGDDAIPGKRDDDLVKLYEEKLAIYSKLVEEAQQSGDLPVLDKM